MAIAHGHVLGEELCRALKVDPQTVRAIDLRLRVDEVARVELDRFVDLEEGRDFIRRLEQYVLVPRDDLAAAIIAHYPSPDPGDDAGGIRCACGAQLPLPQDATLADPLPHMMWAEHVAAALGLAGIR